MPPFSFQSSVIILTVSGANLMRTAFTIFGFKKVEFTVEPLSYMMAAVMICGIAMVTAAVLGRRINALEPVRMITED